MYSILIAAAIVVLDQVLKNVLVKALADGPITIIDNFLYLHYVENYGIAFGMLRNKTLFLIIASIIISITVLFFIYRFRNKSIAVTVCLSLILGGAIGNLIDRIRIGYVIDYISFTIFPPVFNLADSAIVVGSILLSIVILLDKNIKI